MLVLKNIVKEMANDKGKFILDNANFNLKQNEYVEIIGKDRVALDLLVRILSLIERDYQGEYYFDEVRVDALGEKELNDLRIKNIGLVIDQFNLINELTVEENLDLPLVYNKGQVEKQRTSAAQMLTKFNLVHKRQHYPSSLSPFIRLKVAIAQALMLNPRLLILSYDCSKCSFDDHLEMTNLLFRLNEEGLTILTLINEETTTSLAYRKLYLKDGRIISM